MNWEQWQWRNINKLKVLVRPLFTLFACFLGQLSFSYWFRISNIFWILFYGDHNVGFSIHDSFSHFKWCILMHRCFQCYQTCILWFMLSNFGNYLFLPYFGTPLPWGHKGILLHFFHNVLRFNILLLDLYFT